MTKIVAALLTFVFLTSSPIWTDQLESMSR